MGSCQSAAIVHVSVNSSLVFLLLAWNLVVWGIMIYGTFLGHFVENYAKIYLTMAKVPPSATMAGVYDVILNGKRPVLISGDASLKEFYSAITDARGFSNASNNGRWVVTSLADYITNYQNEATLMLRETHGKEIENIRRQEHFGWDNGSGVDDGV